MTDYEVTVYPLLEAGNGLTTTQGPRIAFTADAELEEAMRLAGANAAKRMAEDGLEPVALQVRVVVNP